MTSEKWKSTECPERKKASKQRSWKCDWSEVQREIPYAWRFNKPLQMTFSATYGGNDERFPETHSDLAIFLIWQQENLDSCCKGEQITICSSAWSLSIEEDCIWLTTVKTIPINAIYIDSNEFVSDKSMVIGTHELCPFLQAGAWPGFPSLIEAALKLRSKKFPKLNLLQWRAHPCFGKHLK